MNGFKFSTPRLALGLTAVAMAAITLSVLVVLPAQLDSVSPEALAFYSAATTSSQVLMSPVGGPVRGPAGEAEATVAIRGSHVELGCPDLEAHALSGRHRKSSAAG
jgi:hypothetical protein